MARSHGRILARIWSDDDFRALPGGAQQLYMLLLSQPNLTHAGTLPVTVRRWANMTADATTETVMESLKVLSDRRFVVVEWPTEELLVRTLIRNDGVFKQPKVLRAAKADALTISSPKIRRALAAELAQCPMGEVSVNSRDEVSTLLREISDALGTSPDDPDGGVSDTHTDTPGDGLPEGHATGIGNAPRAQRGGSPSPAPTPAPAVSDGATEVAQPDDDPSKQLTNHYYERLGGMCSWPASRKIIQKAIRSGRDPDQIRTALDRIADVGRSLTIESLRIEMDGKSNLRAVGGYQPYRNPVDQSAYDEPLEAS